MFVDIVIPNGNEEEFVLMAESLGIDGLCFLYRKSDFPDGREKVELLSKKHYLDLFSGILIDSDKLNPLKLKKKFKPDILCSQFHDRKDIKKGLDVVFRVENSNKDFLRFRNSGLDFVKVDLMNKFNVSYAVDFSFIRNLISGGEAGVLSRLTQNFKILRKRKAGLIFASFAETPCDLVNPADAKSFLTVFGASTEQAKTAFLLTYKKILLNDKFNKGLLVEDGVVKLTDEEFKEYLDKARK